MFRSPESVLRAKSIAIVGASERAPWARLIYRNLRDFGYPGRLILVNPRQKEVFGEPCVPSLRDAPEPVEHAMVIVPATGVAGVLEDAEAARVTTATIYSAAMGDGPDPESHKRGAWLKDFLSRSKIKVAGPELHGRLQLSREDLRLSEQRAAALPGRLGERGVPVRRHACSSGCAPRPTAGFASPTASPPATRSASISPTI